MPDLKSVLGQLMQQEADLSQPSDDQCDASWNRISQLIDQVEQERGRPQKSFPSLDSFDSLDNEEWNPKTAFDARSTPRSFWRLPTRRLAAAMLAVFFGVVALLAGALYLQSSGILPGPTSTTIILTDEPIPLADPDAPIPDLDQLAVFLSSSDSTQLLEVPTLSPDSQKAAVEALVSRNCMTIARSGVSALPGTAYWVARKLADQSDKMLVLVAREREGEIGWQTIFQILPKSSDLPSGKALDEYFSRQLAKHTD